MSKSTKHKLVIGPDNDTLFVDRDDVKVRANLRADGAISQYELNFEFENEYDAFNTRKQIIASGEIDLANWTLISQREIFNPANVPF